MIRSQTLLSRDSQLYLLNLQDNSVQALTDDLHYATSSVTWDTTGSQILLERTEVLDNNNAPIAQLQPEIWLYDLNTEDLTQIVANAYSAQWLP